MSNEDGLAMPVTAESTTLRKTKDEKAQTEESATPQRTSEGNATPAATAQGSTEDDMEKNFSREGNGNIPSGAPQVAQEKEKSSAFSGSIHRKPLGDFLGENEKVDREALKDRIDRLLNDTSIQQIISQQYHALKYEMGSMAQRTAAVLACREEYENAKRDFVKALAIMGSHSKSGADVQSVNTVQKYFLTQAMISDIDNKQQKNLKVNMQDAIEEIVIDNVMVDREINRLENCKKKLIEIREVQSVRFMRHGHDDQKGQRLEYRLKLLVDDLQGYKDQLKSTISSLLSKKNNLLTRNLGAYAAVSLLSVQESNKIIVAENKKSIADLKNNTGLSSPVNSWQFVPHVDVARIIGKPAAKKQDEKASSVDDASKAASSLPAVQHQSKAVKIPIVEKDEKGHENKTSECVGNEEAVEVQVDVPPTNTAAAVGSDCAVGNTKVASKDEAEAGEADGCNDTRPPTAAAAAADDDDDNTPKGEGEQT